MDGLLNESFCFGKYGHYESWNSEVVMFCIAMVAFLLFIHTTNRKIRLTLSSIVLSLIFMSSQCILYPIFYVIGKINSDPCLAANSDTFFDMSLETLFKCNMSMVVIVALSVVMFTVFCICAISMAFHTILKESLQENFLVVIQNFVIILFSLILFSSIFFRTLPFGQSIGIPVAYLILSLLFILVKTILTCGYYIIKYLLFDIQKLIILPIKI